MACPKRDKLIWRYLQKLYLLLQRLDESRRQKILNSLSEAQRRDLERWMLQNRSEKKAMPHTEAAPDPCMRRKRLGYREGRGVISRRRRGGWRHFAVVVVQRLEMRSREVDSLHVAVRHHAVLLKLKEEIALELYQQRLRLDVDEALGAKLMSKVTSVLESFQVDEGDLGLYFRAVSPIIGTCLCGPVFHLRSFHLGIAGWQFLQLARGVRSPLRVEELQEIWDRSRRAVSEIWAMTGRCPLEMQRRLDDLERRRSFEGLQKRRAMQQQRQDEMKEQRRQKEMQRGQQKQRRLEERAHQLLLKFHKFYRLDW